MKRILSPGTMAVYRAHCNNCDCEFEYQDEDIQVINQVKIVFCPNCDYILRHKDSTKTLTTMSL